MIMDCWCLDAEVVAFVVSSACLMMVEFPLELTRPVQVVSVDPVEVEGGGVLSYDIKRLCLE